MTTATQAISAEQLLAMGDIGRCELIAGEIIHMAPAGAEHGAVAGQISYLIKAHVDAKDLGQVFAAETGFVIARNPDTVRAPDVAFVRKDHLPGGVVRGFFPGVPDLAVEVVSPSDTLSEMAAKVDQWLAAGTTSVWVVDPPNRSIAVYRGGNQIMRYRGSDELADEPALPGLVVKLGEVFKIGV